jgi:hypothetical protein
MRILVKRGGESERRTPCGAFHTRYGARRPASADFSNGFEKFEPGRFSVFCSGYHVHSTARNGELRATNPRTLATTVAQNLARKDALLDLWRNTCCATIAPGQPPAEQLEQLPALFGQHPPKQLGSSEVTLVTYFRCAQ